MRFTMERNIETFLGCENTFEESQIVIFGAPFDSTTSYRPGTRFASKTMRSESYSIETYSLYQHRDLEDICVYDAGDLELCFGDTKLALDSIEHMTDNILEFEKTPFMIGGEHLVTLGTVRAIAKKYPDLHVIHFDAHADLRDEYLGAELSHASVMHRVWDILGDGRIHQFGIRSAERAEYEWGKEHVETTLFSFEGLDKLVENLQGKPVYFTLDLDVLDTSVFPGTGTPEVGGVSFQELLEAIIKISKLNIVGCDMNELAPNLDPTGASTAVALKLFREMLLAFNK